MREFTLPTPRRFTNTEIQKCVDNKDFRYVFFEYYKYIALLVERYTSIDFSSQGVNKSIKPIEYGVFIGLLNRIQKTILSQITLATERSHKETIIILDRCIMESCLNLIWLIDHHAENSIEIFLASSIKKDLEIELLISKNQEDRNPYSIERRLKEQRNIRLKESGLKEENIRDLSKKHPDIREIFQYLGDNGTMYVFGYIMQSHTVHGDWTGLRYTGYLGYKDGKYFPTDSNLEFDPVQFLNNIKFIFDSLGRFSIFSLDINIDDIFKEEFKYIFDFYNQHNSLNGITIE